MKKFTSGYYPSILFAALLIITLASCQNSCQKSKTSAGDAHSDVIKIGEVSSMTGSEGTFGVSTHNGIELAIKELNDQGGINGKKVQLITVDDQSKPDEAAMAIKKLITQDKV